MLVSTSRAYVMPYTAKTSRGVLYVQFCSKVICHVSSRLDTYICMKMDYNLDIYDIYRYLFHLNLHEQNRFSHLYVGQLKWLRGTVLFFTTINIPNFKAVSFH